MIYDIMIYDHRERRVIINVTVADSGTMKITKDKNTWSWTLYSGRDLIDEHYK